MERVLPEEEIKELIVTRQGLTNKEFVERVANAEHKATLKAIGEWLENHWNGVLREAVVTEREIEAFKRGEMPDKG